MKKRGIKRFFQKTVQLTAAVLFVALIVLTFAVIVAFNRSGLTTDNVPFDLDMLTSSKKSDISEIDGYMLPEFIGLSLNGEKYGISTSESIVSELYSMVTPIISSLISEENVRPLSSQSWSDYSGMKEIIYVRYHNEMPDNIIALFADAALHEKGSEYLKDRNHVLSYVYELILVPTDENGVTRIATRSLGGEVSVYEGLGYDVDYEEISEIAMSYRSSLTRFVFSAETYSSALDTEPVFLDSISTKDIMLSSDTGFFVLHNDSYRESLMRLFSLNPDKLLRENEDASGNISYTDIHGVLYLRTSGFEYQATSDGGVDINEYIGYTKEFGLEEYIRASVEIISELRAINKFFVGNDADIILYSVESKNGRVRLTFEYAVDNIRIMTATPAFVAEFESGKIKHAKICTIAAKTLITRSNSYSESWFIKTIENGIVPINVSLAYENDFRSSSVSAKWAASVPSDKLDGNE